MKNTCLHCKKDYKHKNKGSIYCSNSCRASSCNPKRRKVIPLAKRQQRRERTAWKRDWELYHLGLSSISTMKNLMKDEVFINNKMYDKYELFTPNNI